MYKITVTQNYKKNEKLITIGSYDGPNYDDIYICLEPCNVEEYKKHSKILKLNQTIKPMINYNPSDCNYNRSYYICGASGSGKSYLTSQLLQSIKKKKINKNKEIIIFSHSSDYEEQYAKIKNVSLYNLDENTEDGKEAIEDLKNINLNDLEDKIIVMDDIDANKYPIYKQLMTLCNNVMVNGRKLNIEIICTSHKLALASLSKLILANCQYVVVFPLTDRQQTIYYLTNYQNMTKKEVNDIIDLIQYSRYAIIHIHHPRYILHSHGLILL